MAVLTEDQRASFQKNLADKKAELMELTSKLRAAQQEMNEAMVPFNENLIREKVMNEAKIRADIAILQAKAFADIQPPLSSEQIEKLKQPPQPQARPMIRPMQTPPAASSPAGTNHDANGQPPKE